MKKYTKIYFQESGIDPYDYIPCECCSKQAVDIHHIDCKGMGGNPSGDKDVFENLMALCRECHEEYGDKKQYKDYLQEIHDKKFGL